MKRVRPLLTEDVAPKQRVSREVMFRVANSSYGQGNGWTAGSGR